MGKLERNLKLTHFQFFVLVLIPCFSSVAFMDMGILVENAGADGWITSIIASFFAVLEIYIIISLALRFPNDTIFTFSKKITGKYLGTLINVVYIIYSMIFISFVLRVFLTIVYDIAFSKTPIIIIIILYFLTAAYASTKNIVVISRIAEISFILLLIIIIVVPLLKPDFNIDYLLPVGSSGIKNIFKSFIPYLKSFLGFYSILFLIPYVNNKEKCVKGAIAAISFRTIVFAFYYIMIVGFFGAKRMSMLFWPLLKHISTFSSPIFERIDVVLLMLWAGICLASVYIGFYISKVGLAEILSLKGNKKEYLIIALVFIISVYLTQIPNNYYELIIYSKVIVFLSIGVNFILPLILLILSFLFKRRETA